MNFWQIGGDGFGRNLADLFIKNSVALIGPGDPGDFRTASAAYDPSIVGKSDHSFVRRFARDVKPGDAFLLRIGTNRIIAVGRVAVDPLAPVSTEPLCSPSYFHCESFGDIDGWDLQHGHRVIWNMASTEFEEMIVGQMPSRFSKVSKSEVVKWAEGNFPQLSSTEFTPLPPLPKRLTDEEAANELFGSGLSLKSVDETLAAISRIRRLSRWYSVEGWPLEHEVVAYMVIPLLLALGWSEQQMAVEWNRIDVAVFGKGSIDSDKLRRAQNCCMILEVKQIYEGLTDALRQACSYDDKLKLSTPRCCVATDGLRFRLIERSGVIGQTEAKPELSLASYVNLDKLTSTKVLQRLMPGATPNR